MWWAPQGSSGCSRTGLTQTSFLETWFLSMVSYAFSICSRSIILGILTGGLQMKRENKKSAFLSSPNTYSSGIWRKHTYLVTFQAYCWRRTEKKKTTKLLNTKVPSCFFSHLLFIYKGRKKRNPVFKPTCWQRVCFYLICTSFALIKSRGRVLWLSNIKLLEGPWSWASLS